MAETLGNLLLEEVLFSNVAQAIGVILLGLLAAKIVGKKSILIIGTLDNTPLRPAFGHLTIAGTRIPPS